MAETMAGITAAGTRLEEEEEAVEAETGAPMSRQGIPPPAGRLW